MITSVLYFLLFFILRCCYCLPCEGMDRKYDCHCILEPNNRTVLFENDEQYNISSGNFLPAIKSLQYCQGSFYCKPKFKLISQADAINTKSYMICFSDIECLSNGNEMITVDGLTESCVKGSCMYLKDLLQFNITNDSLEVGTYSCFNVGLEGLKIPYCLKPACKSFVAIEKICMCYQSQNCSCSSYCNPLKSIVMYKTYALFLSFGDIYITEGAKISYLHWIVVTILSIGLTFLLLIFCKLCEKAMDPNNTMQAHNIEVLRRMLAANIESNGPSTVNTTSKCYSPPQQRQQSSPPPTYEQVLKDKCVEFKRSIA